MNNIILQVGCTTPYEPNKTNICMNQGDRNRSLEMYKDTYESIEHKNICHHPCNFIITRATITSSKIGNATSAHMGPIPDPRNRTRDKFSDIA